MFYSRPHPFSTVKRNKSSGFYVYTIEARLEKLTGATLYLSEALSRSAMARQSIIVFTIKRRAMDLFLLKIMFFLY